MKKEKKMCSLLLVIADELDDILKNVDYNIDVFSITLDDNGNCVHIELCVEDCIPMNVISKIAGLFDETDPAIYIEHNRIKLVMVNNRECS